MAFYFEMNLDGYYLSDDQEELQKWQFPYGTLIPANGFLIVWADDDETDGQLHATFKLSADGEELILSDSERNIIDQVSFGEQTADISYARYPNGTGDFRKQEPTYNKSNDDLVAVEFDKKVATQFMIYPVPARDKLHIRTKDTFEQPEIKILNLLGQKVLTVSSETKMLDIST